MTISSRAIRNTSSETEYRPRVSGMQRNGTVLVPRRVVSLYRVVR